ncbi:MAG: nitroreductase family protein [Candidatus Marinimicrobia bacterium]|jgi:nitroreductase|nr:nitroreductase family protein [Candidatus Neomarinimicrobiota bacterium]
MDFSELIKIRQSVRSYSDKAVEKEKIEKCLEAARLAPSASNSQPWKYIVVNDEGLKNKVAEATFDKVVKFNKFAVQAPIIIVIVIEKPKIITQIGGEIKRREFPLIDIGISAEHFCLQAVELGLGTCMIGWFDQKRIKDLLNIPKKKTLGLLITLGYAPDDYALRKKIRKDRSEIVGYNKY